MKEDKKPKIEALKNLAKVMAKLELDKVNGYKKIKDEEDEDEDDLVKVLTAKKG